MNSQINVLYPKPARAAGSVIASQSLAVSTVAVTPTGYTTTGSGSSGSVALITFDVQTSDVRARWDGTAPTATVGHKLYAGTAYTWSTDQFNNTQFIRDTAATADAVIFSSPLNA